MKMKRYWVGINGSIVVEAENEDEAYHKAYFKALQVLEKASTGDIMCLTDCEEESEEL